jgi:hypothetical protein
MRGVAMVTLVLLVACGRPVTPDERSFLDTIHGAALDTTAVRLHDGLAEGAPIMVPPRPRLTCQERLFPPRSEPAASSPGAMTIFQSVYFRGDLYRPDFSRSEFEGQEVVDLLDAMLLAHEMTHVWQWQNRDLTGYHPLKAAFEHVVSPDPYLFDPDSRADFLSFGYEQQGSIVEEYVCCRTLAPEAERTRRLHAMLAAVMPVAPLQTTPDKAILLPWNGVEIEGICD